MRVVDKLGDRLLGMVLPRLTASAGCPPDCWYQACGTCYRKRCCYTGACKVSCGSCGYSITSSLNC